MKSVTPGLDIIAFENENLPVKYEEKKDSVRMTMKNYLEHGFFVGFITSYDERLLISPIGTLFSIEKQRILVSGLTTYLSSGEGGLR